MHKLQARVASTHVGPNDYIPSAELMCPADTQPISILRRRPFMICAIPPPPLKYTQRKDIIHNEWSLAHCFAVVLFGSNPPPPSARKVRKMVWLRGGGVEKNKTTEKMRVSSDVRYLSTTCIVNYVQCRNVHTPKRHQQFFACCIIIANINLVILSRIDISLSKISLKTFP